MTDWVVDLDGVMWRGGEPIAGSAEAVSALLGRGDRVLFATNNSTASGRVRAEELVDLGIPNGVEVVTSADAVCTMIEPGERILVLGSDGLMEALAAHGADVVSSTDMAARPIGTGGDPGRFDAVVVGLTREFDFAQLDLVAATVRAGARLLATNADRTFPAAGRIQPGTGALLAAVEAASGGTAAVAGKPEAPMAELIEQRLGADASQVVVVGDRPSTDGALAHRMDRPFALVLSGVTSEYRPPRAVPVEMVALDFLGLVEGRLLEGVPVA